MFSFKLINQESLYMYDITTIPVPYHMNEELIDETESKNKLTTEVLFLWRCSQINHIITMTWHIVFNIP